MTETQAQTETRTCEKHGDYEAEIVQLLGSRMLAKPCPECSEEARQREEQQRKDNERAARNNRLQYRLSKSGIPRRFESADFGGYQPPTQKATTNQAMCRAYAARFPERCETGGSLVLCGRPGTGKTHLACAIANQVIREHEMPVVYTSVTKLARSVKATYSKDADMTEEQAIQSFVEPQLLIVDEVGAQRGTETELLLAQEIIDERYQQMKPTIIISNLTESELAGFIGERALDRMYEGGGAVLAFDWKSYRRAGAEA